MDTTLTGSGELAVGLLKSQSYLKMDTTLTDIADTFTKHSTVSILLKNGYHSDFQLDKKFKLIRKSQSYLKMDTTLTGLKKNYSP